MNPHKISLLTITALLAVGMMAAQPTWAGCGCDHPPPEWGLIMPAFAAPDETIAIHADSGEFIVGETYKVAFGKKRVDVVAESVGRLDVTIPDDVNPGPREIKVDGPSYAHDYPKELFTVLGEAAPLPDESGLFLMRDWKLAITTDGTLLMPIDVSRVLDATQFAFQLQDLALTFDVEDVVIYNADGIDLSLFTLSVEDSTERQWGSYYGWEVEDDTKLMGFVYDNKVKKSKKMTESDIFTYWRHEFYTYAAAHAEGGTHEVGEDGFHLADGTLHIDHDQLIIAITGLKRDSKHPEDLSRADPFSGGHVTVDVGMVAVQVENPVEPKDMSAYLESDLVFQEL